jgi:hypothetical protein
MAEVSFFFSTKIKDRKMYKTKKIYTFASDPREFYMQIA